LAPAAEQLIRSPILLQKGLNIIWAPAASMEERNETDFGGHAAGKTTFCRLLRYLLGEAHCAAQDVRDALAGAFPDGWVVGKIHVGIETWIVARPFHPHVRPRARCMKTANIEDLLAAPTESLPLADFLLALRQAIVAPLPVKLFGDGTTNIELDHVLQWFTRDQECRYSRLNEFRHTDSNSHSPNLSSEDAYFLQRIILELADEDLQQAITVCEKLEERAKELPPDKEYALRRERELNQALEDAAIKNPTAARLSALDFEPTRKTLEQKKKAALHTLSNAQKLAKASKDKLVAELPSLREKLGAINHQISQAEDDESKAQAQLDALDGKARDENIERKQDKKRPTPDYCRVPKEIARSCPRFQEWNVPDDNEEKSEILIESRKQATEAFLERCRSDITSLKAEQETLQARISKVEREAAALEIQITDYQTRRVDLAAPFKTLGDQIDALETVVQNLEDLQREEAGLAEKVKTAQRSQEELQKRHREQEGRFINEFTWTITRILGGESAEEDQTLAEGTCSFTREKISAKVNYRGKDLGSAAVTTIKILCFDFAAMSLSCRGYGQHPRFLLHDSPREADMGASLYGRFFDLIASQAKVSPNFQHIITTTSQPPKEFQGMPSVRLKLDSASPAGRLFCVDL